MGKGYSLRSDRWRNDRERAFKVFLRRILANRHDLLVTISTERGDDDRTHWSHEAPPYKHVREIGSTSWTPWLLPFKSEHVLQRASNGDVQYISDFMRPKLVPMLDRHGGPIVRIEAMNSKRTTGLDAWVYGIAQEAGLEKVWNEGIMHAHTAQWMQENGVYLSEYVVPKEHRI
jgi:hypothetical protein